MIGKLQVWRGEREEKEAQAQDKMRVGDFVFLDDLDRKSKDPSPNKPVVAPAKKVNTELW